MAEQAGQPIPERIRNKPHLKVGLQLYYRAFWDLSTCRQLGMSQGPIPWTSAKEWCDEMSLWGSQRSFLYTLVSRMDMAYLKHHSAKIKGK